MNDTRIIPPKLKSKIKAHNAIVAGFSLLLVFSYLGFNLVIVFAPHLLSLPYSNEMPIPIGIFIGLALIIFFFILSIIYILIEKDRFSDEREYRDKTGE